jgi:hypothetical protein
MIEKDFLVWLITKRKLDVLNFPVHYTEAELKDFLNKLYILFKNQK